MQQIARRSGLQTILIGLANWKSCLNVCLDRASDKRDNEKEVKRTMTNFIRSKTKL